MISVMTLLLIALGIQVVLFIPAYIFRTDKITDFSYGITFVALSLVAFIFNGYSIPRLLLMILIAAWATRLIWYLLARISVMKRDARFDGIREHIVKFLFFWLFQGFMVWILLIPTIFFMNNEISEISIISLLGLGIWALGLSIETLADCQKFKFKNRAENKGKWISSGLWKYSRHPNFFGEWLVWVGIYIYAIPGLVGNELWISIASPLFILLMLLFGSGIPTLERKYNKRYVSNEEYQKYKRNTSIFIPWFNKKT